MWCDTNVRYYDTRYAALNPLEAPYKHGGQRVEFQYADYQVTVQADQTILVSEPNT